MGTTTPATNLLTAYEPGFTGFTSLSAMPWPVEPTGSLALGDLRRLEAEGGGAEYHEDFTAGLDRFVRENPRLGSAPGGGWGPTVLGYDPLPDSDDEDAAANRATGGAPGAAALGGGCGCARPPPGPAPLETGAGRDPDGPYGGADPFGSDYYDSGSDYYGPGSDYYGSGPGPYGAFSDEDEPHGGGGSPGPPGGAMEEATEELGELGTFRAEPLEPRVRSAWETEGDSILDYVESKD